MRQVLFIVAAAVAAGRCQAAQSDYISSCGNSSMPSGDVETNHGAINRKGYLSAVAAFCKQADGKTVSAGGYLSMATRVFLNEDKDPTESGLNGYVYFEVYNKQKSGDHKVNANDCSDHLKQLSKQNSKCWGSQYNDTKGGTWEVGQDEVSYQAQGQSVLPAQDAIDKLYTNGPLSVRTVKNGAGLDPFPTDFTKDVSPIPCHSHNDYVQSIPLYLALSAGCISVEGDVYIHGTNLRVAHLDPGDSGPTLQELYLEPLKAILDAQQSIYPTNSDQDLTMLIEFKNSPNSTWDAVVDALKPLRDAGYLSHWDGSKFVRGKITAVATGMATLEKANDANANPNHALFVDAPLGGALGGYNMSNAFYASASFLEAVEFNFETKLSSGDLNKMKGQIGVAHGQGLKVRYYEIPSKDMWQQMLDIGVDRINVDYFEDIASLDFTNSSASNQSGSATGTGSAAGSTSTPSQAVHTCLTQCLQLLFIPIMAMFSFLL